MDYLKRIKRPEIWMEILGVLLLILWMIILPHVHLYSLNYSDKLLVQTTEGEVSFRKNNKTGQEIIIDNQAFTCALDTIGKNTCYHHMNTGETGGLPVNLAGQHAVIQWIELESFPWQRLRVVINLNIAGKVYRTAADFDRELTLSKRLAMKFDLFNLLLYSVYVWFRLTFRPRLHRS